jgi:hypothetical protein
MRGKISESRIAHAEVESRLELLNKNVNILSDKIQILRPSSKIIVEEKKDLIKHISRAEICFAASFSNIAPDSFCNILEYLQIEQIFKLSFVSKSIFGHVTSDIIWYRLFPIFFPRAALTKIPLFVYNSRENEYKRQISSYLQEVRRSVDFISAMKEQRCVPKHRQTQTHLYSRSDKEVSHPLPLFAPSSSSPLEIIMSRSETLSSEFRSLAHGSLAAMARITSDPGDQAVGALLAREGAATVLVSLLSNEEGAIRSYACCLLANLLCWEARRDRDSRGGGGGGFHQRREAWLNSFVCLFSRSLQVHASSTKGKRRDTHLHRQVTACNGHKQLAGLLTSPSASVNLAPGCGAKSSGGLKGMRMTASVQGVSTKQASRALICLFYPLMGVPILSPCLELDHSISNPSETHRKMLFNDISIAQLSPISACCNRQLTTSTIGGLFTTDERARPWQFTYYYKSGTLKDQFVAYMRFLPGGFVQGRGVDDIGTFFLSGNADPDILGRHFFFILFVF